MGRRAAPPCRLHAAPRARCGGASAGFRRGVRFRPREAQSRRGRRRGRSRSRHSRPDRSRPARASPSTRSLGMRQRPSGHGARPASRLATIRSHRPAGSRASGKTQPRPQSRQARRLIRPEPHTFPRHSWWPPGRHRRQRNSTSQTILLPPAVRPATMQVTGPRPASVSARPDLADARGQSRLTEGMIAPERAIAARHPACRNRSGGSHRATAAPKCRLRCRRFPHPKSRPHRGLPGNAGPWNSSF